MTNTVLDFQPSPSPKNFILLPVGTYSVQHTLNVNFDSIDCDGLVIIADVTALGGTVTPSVTFAVTGYDPISGATYTLGTSTGLSSGAMSTASLKVMRIQPQIPNATLIAQDMVPPMLQITTTLAGTTPSWTGSLALAIDL